MEKEKLSFPVFKDMAKNGIRLLKLIFKDKKGLIIFRLSLLFLMATIPFLQNGSQGLLINELIKITGTHSSTAYFFWLVVAWSFIIILPRFGDAFETYTTKLFYFYLDEKVETTLLKKYGELDIISRENKEISDLLNRVQEKGLWGMRNFIDRWFWILQNILEIIFASSVIIFSNWFLFLMLFLGTLPEMIVEVKYGKEIWGIHAGKAEVRRKYWEFRSHFSVFSKVVELKLLQNIKYFLSSVINLFKIFQKEQKDEEKEYLKASFLSLFFSQSVLIFASIYFIFKVLDGSLQVGTFVFIVASIAGLRRSLSGFFSNMGRQYQDGLFVSDVFKLLDTKEVIVKPQKGIILDTKQTPKIIFENVSFAYPETDKKILKNISLKIEAGEKLALIGANGAGKTTLVKLLCRFYDPVNGKVLINGHDLKNIDLESWYSQIGVIFQDYANYRILVKEAIAVGRTTEKAKIEKIKESAKASEADIFIEDWEKGYDQTLGKNFTEGVEPSVGQWQKLALARTFYRDPQILILDEPTSSIDAESEAKIFDKLEALPKDRTVILISHRFSTVRKANKIAVIEKGGIKEYGTHKELLKLNGTYARLFKLQAKGYR
ncbi:MAG: ABC transporter ATP-binding protein [Candidatus Pacebacteria bacterium]|nr:ABC transporter ATP-binding protein [Candidatus Paceibacterota bacterium]